METPSSNEASEFKNATTTTTQIIIWKQYLEVCTLSGKFPFTSTTTSQIPIEPGLATLELIRWPILFTSFEQKSIGSPSPSLSSSSRINWAAKNCLCKTVNRRRINYVKITFIIVLMHGNNFRRSSTQYFVCYRIETISDSFIVAFSVVVTLLPLIQSVCSTISMGGFCSPGIMRLEVEYPSIVLISVSFLTIIKQWSIDNERLGHHHSDRHQYHQPQLNLDPK